MNMVTVYSVNDKDYADNALIFLNGIYLHGKIESHFGNDICGTDGKMFELGITDVTVHGYSNPCVAYVWRLPNENNMWRGLIVDKTDEESIEYAEKAYNERAIFI